VSGAVNSPGSVLWEKGKGLDYYVSGAGGFSYRADKGRVTVHYANGEIRTKRRTLLFSSSPRPGPGSEVLVPVKDTVSRTSNVPGVLSALAQVLVSLATLVVVATR
jgi:protein involved in polysaccharide export with SLBB domain